MGRRQARAQETDDVGVLQARQDPARLVDRETGWVSRHVDRPLIKLAEISSCKPTHLISCLIARTELALMWLLRAATSICTAADGCGASWVLPLPLASGAPLPLLPSPLTRLSAAGPAPEPLLAKAAAADVEAAEIEAAAAARDITGTSLTAIRSPRHLAAQTHPKAPSPNLCSRATSAPKSMGSQIWGWRVGVVGARVLVRGSGACKQIGEAGLRILACSSECRQVYTQQTQPHRVVPKRPVCQLLVE